MKSQSESYKEAGVDITSGYRAVELMKEHVGKTMKFGNTAPVGGFGGLLQPDLTGMSEPILVSGTDGVGTKLKLAFLQDKHDTVGIDCVAMCVNDILCHGAQPLFFLDYLACGKLDSNVSSEIIKGVVEGCLQGDSALVGGETAEMPGFYADGEYDIAGFAVGVVEEEKMVNGSKVQEGDVIVAIPSSGAHSNGFSLLRKLFTDFNEEYNGKTIGEHLLTPTKIYVKPIQKVMEKVQVNGMAHITGGGLIENVPRTIPDGLCANIEKAKVKVHPLFKHETFSRVPEEEMWGTFNMGVGFVVIVNKNDAQTVIDILAENGEEAYELGTIVKGDEKINLY